MADYNLAVTVNEVAAGLIATPISTAIVYGFRALISYMKECRDMVREDKQERKEMTERFITQSKESNTAIINGNRTLEILVKENAEMKSAIFELKTEVTRLKAANGATIR